MPPNIHQPAANSPVEWYYSLPPITRLYGTVCVAVTLLSVVGLVNPVQLYLSWPLVFGKLQVISVASFWPLIHVQDAAGLLQIFHFTRWCAPTASQIWRLLTCFIFLGKPSFVFLLRVLYM